MKIDGRDEIYGFDIVYILFNMKFWRKNEYDIYY